MSENKDFLATFAIIADIHGNRWALEAVLRDIDRRGIQQIINLGDHLTGPLDPVGTADLLLKRTMLNICGNDDRVFFFPAEALSPAQQHTRALLSPVHLQWLHSLPATAVVAHDLFACHGDLFDVPYLLEQVAPPAVFLRSTPEIEVSVSSIIQPVILCGHSHLPHTVSLPQGKLIINPGSVGLPAYTVDTPVFYAMEAGSPHARYAILCKMQTGWQVEHIHVSYPWEQAAQAAYDNHRPDWAQWLITGRG